MRILRALLIALLTALVGSILALLVGDHLTTLVRVPEIEGQRGMMMFFVCVPLGMIASLVIGTTTSVLVQSRTRLVAACPLRSRRCVGWRALSVVGQTSET
jgi:hypothetical protein